MKKITLLFMLCFALQYAEGQNSCGSPVALTAAGLYTVGTINGTAPATICAITDPNVNPTAGEWYAYTPSQDFTVTISTDISQNSPRVDTRFHVYTGTCGSLTCLAGDDDAGLNYSSVATFNVTANTTYLISFDNRWTNNNFTFQLLENPLVVAAPTPVTFVAQNIPTIQSGNYNLCGVDMNNDFRDDIVGVSDDNIRIHFQNVDGSFTVTNIATENADFLPSWSLSAGDYNKDGFNDLIYGGGAGLTFMKSNDTGTAYTEDSPGEYIFCQRTNFVDINNDGNLDAFSCHDVDPNVYYINNGSGEFSYFQSGQAGAYSLGLSANGGNYGSIWIDYDNDGDLDLFIAKCGSVPPDELHRNNGDGTFSDISVQMNMYDPGQSWSSAWADFDNDGDMDAIIGASSGAHVLKRNDLDTTNAVEEPFVDITAGSGWDTNTATSIEHIAYDFDNDGFVDVMGGGNKIMYNNGDMTFSPVTTGFSVGAVADFNNDGFLDIQNGSVIYKSQGNANKWITINLKGIQSNSNGIGARVEIYGAWGKQIRDVRSGEGFKYMSTLNVHFGIGTASSIDQVVIKWPSGVTDVIVNPSSNQSLTVIEGSFPLAVNQVANTAFSISPNPANEVLQIQSSQSIEFKNATIFDLTGRKVLESVMSTQTIEVRSLAIGTYILVLKDQQGNQFSQKFLKN